VPFTLPVRRADRRTAAARPAMPGSRNAVQVHKC
jgi:hypothetical protein